ncbi:hypothetical protein DYB37_008267 [Aphanomyces astaci]|uniref:Uncharacterized protein n=3 Tax=Aphanomyces astaci TaxID=112090 RepID=A0A3R7AL03_APHAT|nr:hypothetical protein DYB37_008267 [Aphanomyces astaci]RQM29637.1 hypothetical protein B5M09_005938 [Aphanomyces astaci]
MSQSQLRNRAVTCSSLHPTTAHGFAKPTCKAILEFPSTPSHLPSDIMTLSSVSPHLPSARSHSADFQESFKALVKQTMLTSERYMVLSTSPTDVALGVQWRRDYNTATSQPIAINFGHRRTLSFDEVLAAEDDDVQYSPLHSAHHVPHDENDDVDDNIFVMEL